MFKLFESTKSFNQDDFVSQKQIQDLIPDQNKVFQQNITNDSFTSQINQNQTLKFISLKIKSNKSLMKANLKDSLVMPRFKSLMSLNQDKMTAASLKDLKIENQCLDLHKSTSGKLQFMSNHCQFSTNHSMNQPFQGFQQDYQTLQVIGQGAHATVYKCQQKNNETKFYALKKIKNISIQNEKNLKLFYILMKNIAHQNILKYEKFYFDKQKNTALILMEYCQSKDLRNQIIGRQKLNEKFSTEQIFQITKQLVSVLKYLHSEGICHRDIKPENILYDKSNGKIKLIDLDICGAKKFKKDKFQLWTNTGTLFYRAPQTFGIGYTQKADIWSLGIVIYELINKRTPFLVSYQKDYIQMVRNTQINYDRINTSKKIKYILRMCLQKKQENRADIIKLYNFIQKVSKDESNLQNKYSQKQEQQKKSYYQQCDKNLIALGSLLKCFFN